MSEHLFEISLNAAALVVVLVAVCVVLKHLGKKGDDDRFGPHPD